jgi:uncharacterized protein YqjF (DUF2071 family)
MPDVYRGGYGRSWRAAERGPAFANVVAMMPWLIAMDWIDAVFVHWMVDAAQLRSRIPADLRLDTFDGNAWVGVVAFRIAHARPRGVPAAMGFPTFPEINVRTYVSGGAHAGVWFFSLDATSRAAVAMGRRGVHLPYHRASIAMESAAGTTSYRLRRTQADAPPAQFCVEASSAARPRSAVPGSLDHWLAERYCFFTTDSRGRTRRGDVAHGPWPLRDATVRIDEAGSLLRAAGIEPLPAPILAHVSAGVSTHAWPLR